MNPATRSARGALCVAAAALAAVPLAVAIGRGAPLYVARADEIWLQYRSITIYPVDLLVVLTVGAWLVARGAGWRGGQGARPVLLALALGALALAAAGSAITALDPVLAIGTAVDLAILAVFCLAAAEIAGARPRGLPEVLCVTVVAEAALAGWQALTQSTAPAGRIFNGWDHEFGAGDVAASVAALPGVDRWLRSYGSFPHPNTLGAFLAVALAVILMAPSLPRSWRAVAFVAGTAALTLTLSRSAWLALALAATVWLVATGGLSRVFAARRVPAAAALTLLLVFAGASTASARLGRLDAPIEQGSFDERLAENAAAWTLSRTRDPVGAGNIVIAEQTVAPALGEPAHDVFLIAVAEMGMPGVVGWVALFCVLAGVAWVGRADPLARAAPLVAAAALLPLLLLDHFLWTQPSGRTLVALLLALSTGMTSTADRHS